MREINYRTKTIIFFISLSIVILSIYIAGLWISEDMVAGDFLNAKHPPSFTYPFGTDALGRNLFLCTLKGLSTSITIGVVASAISAFIAVLIGAATAMGSGKMDCFINWMIDLFMGVPHTVLILLVSFAFGRGLKGLILGICSTHWCSLSRLIRGEILQLRTKEYILISKKMGKSTGWIMINHMLPHLTGQFFAGLILMFPHVILHEASVSFLGFGLPPEQPAIGTILAESMRYLSTGMWWSAVLPGLSLVLIVVLLDYLGNSLRKILDPYSIQE